MTPSGHPNSAQHLKKVVYAVGLPSAISVSLGWLFLMLHWPGGSELFNYGLLVFLLVFVPLLGIDRYHVGTRRMPEKGSMILGIISALVIGLALGFKLLHLQGADLLLVAGFVTFTFGFLPLLFFTMYWKSVHHRVG